MQSWLFTLMLPWKPLQHPWELYLNSKLTPHFNSATQPTYDFQTLFSRHFVCC